MNFEKSQTLQNLINAFAGESQARNRYTFYSKIAKKEGYEQIAEIFYQTSENEKEHAKLFYKHILPEQYAVNGLYPFFTGNTYENLIAAFNGETEEWELIYKNSANTAKEEGFDDISKLFLLILEIEKYHAHRFRLLADALQNKTLFNKAEAAQWVCRKCGHILISKNAPVQCPVCAHSQGYFQIFTDKY